MKTLINLLPAFLFFISYTSSSFVLEPAVHIRRIAHDDTTLQWVAKVDHKCAPCAYVANEINTTPSVGIGRDTDEDITSTGSGANAIGRSSCRILESTYDCFIEFEGDNTFARHVMGMECVEFVDANQEVAQFEDGPRAWGLDRIDQQDLPLDNHRFITPWSGNGQTIYVLDTGVYPNHIEFTGRAKRGGDFINERPRTDNHGHGTHTAATAAGNTVGVAREANIVAVKVLNRAGRGSTSGVIEGIQWAVDNARQRASVISMSLGGSISEAMDAAVRAASARGHIVVVAAGNSGGDACRLSPARAGGSAREDNDVISVGATMRNDDVAYFSNQGACVDIFAPGHQIVSASRRGRREYVAYSGTSMAAPYVSGVAATLLEKHMGDKNATMCELFDVAVEDRLDRVDNGTVNLLLQSAQVGDWVSPSPVAPPTRYPTDTPTTRPTRAPTPRPTRRICSTITYDRSCRRKRWCRWRRNPATKKKECIDRNATPFPTPSPTARPTRDV